MAIALAALRLRRTWGTRGRLAGLLARDVANWLVLDRAKAAGNRARGLVRAAIRLPHSASPAAPLANKAAISSSEKPASASTSRVFSPSLGGMRRVGEPGVLSN